MGNRGIDTAGQIKVAFAGAAEAVKIATEAKMAESRDRILSGESEQSLLDGLPNSWVKQILQKVNISRNLSDPNLLPRLQEHQFTSIDQKALEYAKRILRGEDPQSVLEGTHPSWRGRVYQFVQAIREIPAPTKP